MGNMGRIFSSEKAQVPDKEGKMVENCSNNKASKESRKYSGRLSAHRTKDKAGRLPLSGSSWESLSIPETQLPIP